jgi:type IV pilus assembly protein PilB
MDQDEGSERLSRAVFARMILRAHRRGATCLHVEPENTALRVRYRVDGSLYPGESLPLALHAPLLRHIRRTADTEFETPRLPQTGLLSLSTSSRRIPCHVEIMPGVRGEKVVVWLREPSRRVERPLSELGMSQEQLGHLRAALRQRSGLIVLAGPTFSGKNTTAYSCLLELGPEGRSLASIERVVRAPLPEVHQLVEDLEAGLTQAVALRALMRADHEVIYVRELLEPETAEQCLRAVLCHGRLVITTIHTVDAAGVIDRLVGMELERWRIASSLLLVQAQRRLRRLCSACRREARVVPRVLTTAGLPPGHPLPEALHVPVGCEHCQGTGYAGQLLVCESMPLTPPLQELIRAGAAQEKLKRAAVLEGMKTLRVSGLERVCEGATSLEEVLMSTPRDRR